MLEQFVITQSIRFISDLIFVIIFIKMSDIFFDSCFKIVNKKGIDVPVNENKPETENKGVIGFIKSHQLSLSVYIFLQMLIILDKYQEDISWIPAKYL